MESLSATVWFLIQLVYVSGVDGEIGLMTPFQVTQTRYLSLEECQRDLKDIALQPNFLGYNWKVEYINEKILIARDSFYKEKLPVISQLSCMEIEENSKT
tara:strand:+ start:866 stop:1165 length:300 start_codon:yes stop_codon:yes gene_type:complete